MNPIRRCIICGHFFWAGLPRLGFETVNDFRGGKQLWFGWVHWPEWVEHCSRECADADLVATFGPDPKP